MPDKIVIRFGKGRAAKKSVMRGQRRGVRAWQYQVPMPVNFGSFFLCFTAPQHKHKVLSVLIELIYHRIGKFFPTFPVVRGRLSVKHGQTAVKKQNTSLRPMFKIAMRWRRNAQIGVQFFENILQRWRFWHALAYGKAEAMCLTRAVIGVLTQNHHFYLVKRGQREGVKNLTARRVDFSAGGLFGAQELT